MEDLTKRPVASLAPTGQLTDAVSSREPAMTAPGSDPAQDVSPLRANAPAAEVTAEPYDGRHLAGDGREEPHGASWDDVSGRRESWGPG